MIELFHEKLMSFFELTNYLTELLELQKNRKYYWYRKSIPKYEEKK